MKQTAAFILLGSIAVGIAAALHEKRKARNHKPAATLRDLYEDNAACGSAVLYEGGNN